MQLNSQYFIILLGLDKLISDYPYRDIWSISCDLVSMHYRNLNVYVTHHYNNWMY